MNSITVRNQATRVVALLFALLLTISIKAQELSLYWSGTHTQDTTINVWRGERISMEGCFTVKELPAEPLLLSGRGRKGVKVETGILGGVLTDEGRHCGPHDMSLPTRLAWDVVCTDSLWTGFASDSPDSVRILCTVDLPRNTKPGKHNVEVRLVGADTRTIYAYMTLHLNVLDRALPPPHEYEFHSDFWQQPYSVSRYYGVERWSREHMELLRPYMKLLARSGQKCVTTILFYEPWGDQSLDKFSPMVETTLLADSTWSYDYAIFDKWVEFMQECGIDEQINCYSMVPWDMTFRYWDEAKGSYSHIKLTTSDTGYDELWTSFLTAFAEHLKEKGWFSKTCIAMDERSMPDMMRAYNIAQKAVPGIKMALAGNYHAELSPLLHDYSIAFAQRFPTDTLEMRRQRGQHSTVYTCCTEPLPNLFSNSHPLEATYLPLFAISNGFNGYLHWSWMNWTEDPLHDSRFRLFSPGDTYCIYPQHRSSLRWERYIEGVEMAEKVRLCREQLQKDTANVKAQQHLQELESALSLFRDGDASSPEEVGEKLETLRTLLNNDD